MSAASSVGSSVGSSVASSVARTAGGFDSDALAYFAAVEAAGGSFDLSELAKAPNKLTFSQQFDNAAWLVIDANKTQNTAISPNGDLTADTLASTAMPTVTSGIVYRPIAMALAGTTQTFSVYLRADAAVKATLFINKASGLERATTTVDVTTSWQRFSVTGSFASDSSDGKLFVHIAPGGVGVATGSVYAWGAQLEEGASASAYARYSTSYVKQAHSRLFTGLKSDGLWSKITELYLLSGKTYAGMAVKAKGTGSLTLTNFVSGDYVSAGSGAGLKGNGSTKDIATGLNDNTLLADDKSFGAYRTAVMTSGTMFDLGADNGSNFWVIGSGSSNGIVRAGLPVADADISITTGVTNNGFVVGSRRGVNDVEVYRNGSSIGVDTTSVAAANVNSNWTVFARSNGGTPTGHSNARLSAAHIGTGLTDTDAANLSTRINAFMTALGANVY